jgi:hypothetical protein
VFRLEIICWVCRRRSCFLYIYFYEQQLRPMSGWFQGLYSFLCYFLAFDIPLRDLRPLKFTPHNDTRSDNYRLHRQALSRPALIETHVYCLDYSCLVVCWVGQGLTTLFKSNRVGSLRNLLSRVMVNSKARALPAAFCCLAA